MGACVSCLGRERRNSTDAIDENDPLIDDSNHMNYGAVIGQEETEPDQEELRFDRAALDHISTHAQENMIDALHQNTSEINHHLTMIKEPEHCHDWNHEAAATDQTEDQMETEDATWLEFIKASEADSFHAVKGATPGALVMDLSRLRDNTSALAKKPFRR